MKIPLRPLGATRLMVSPIGLGLVKLGRNTGVKYPGGGGFALPSDEQAADLLRTALALDINLLDTAPAYGVSEERLGQIMSANGWFGGRERWVICTKAGEEFDAATANSSFDFSPAAIGASVERSLRRLNTDHVDIVLLHSDGRDEWVLRQSGAVMALRELQEVGRIGAVGISTKSPEGGQLAVAMGLDVVMVTLNPEYAADLPVIDAARTRREATSDAARPCGVLIKKALASGHAADPAAAIRYAAGVPGVSSVVIGTMRPENLRANVAALYDAV
jgi:aryl-alcohol dehydrogenase-like predicted oxidoreductase